MVIKRGSIWWADLDSPRGSGPGYRRPVVVIQSDSFNRSKINTVVVVVITGNLRLAEAPGNVFLKKEDSGLEKDSVHINMRMKNRFISRQMILESSDNYEIIESYPEDKYFPSYLIYSRYQDTVFHVVFAVDVENMNVRIITAYRPDPQKWWEDFKRRRK